MPAHLYRLEIDCCPSHDLVGMSSLCKLPASFLTRPIFLSRNERDRSLSIRASKVTDYYQLGLCDIMAVGERHHTKQPGHHAQ